MLKLKLQYLGHLMWRADSLEKTLMLGKIEGKRRGGQQRTRWLDSHHQLSEQEFEPTPGDGEGQGSLACCSPWVAKSWTQLDNWATTITNKSSVSLVSRCIWKNQIPDLLDSLSMGWTELLQEFESISVSLGGERPLTPASLSRKLSCPLPLCLVSTTPPLNLPPFLNNSH